MGLEGFSGSGCKASPGSVGGSAPGVVGPGLIRGNPQDPTEGFPARDGVEACPDLIGGSSGDPSAGDAADWAEGGMGERLGRT